MPPSADRTLPRRPLRLLGGAAVSAVIALLIVSLFWSIIAAAATAGGSPAHFDLGYLLYITTLQATLSTALSLVCGVALAWALNRLRFLGRSLVIALFATAIVMPGLVIGFGLLDIWGRSGWLGGLNVPVFGLGGVVAAHLILDATFAARILLNRLEATPATRLKIGQSLGLDPWVRFRVIDWPAMAATLPGLAAIIFLLAFTSFPIVLLLGGGPAVETLELAIYQSVRLDFDLGAAVTLALIQIAICGAVILLSAALAPVSASLDTPPVSRWRDRGAARAVQWAVLLLAIFGFAAPLLAVLADGLAGMPAILTQGPFWSATWTSVWIACVSAIVAAALALVISAARAASVRPWARIILGVPAFTYLAVPAVTLALGAFLLVRTMGIPTDSAGPVVVVVANALLTLPFAVATLGPAFDAVARSRGKLIRSLGLSGRTQFLAIEWPLIAPDLGLVLALGFCFSLGDLGIISLFGTQGFSTLPLLMVRALGAYRAHDAAAIASLLLVLVTGVFFLLPRLFARLTDARA